jgi:hypothetical protein
MLKYQIIERRNIEEITIEILEFPQQLKDFLRKEIIYHTANDTYLGIISDLLYMDNIKGLWPVSETSGPSIALPLVKKNKKAVSEHGTEGRLSIKYRGGNDRILLAECIVTAMNQLYKAALHCDSLIKIVSAPYVPEKVPLFRLPPM